MTRNFLATENFSGFKVFHDPKFGTKPSIGQNFSGPQILLLELVPVGMTLFSNVTARTSTSFTLKEGSIGLYFKEGERVGVLMVSGRCLIGV